MRTFSRFMIVIATVTAAVAALGLARGGPQAGAEVIHGTGYEATVMGWTSWYGSYMLRDVGMVWCIDHGLRAPDSEYGYRPTAQPAIPLGNRTAMAWILARHGQNPTRIDAAATMLALHDLNGAVYPQGRLDLRALSPDRLAGFGGDDATVFARAVEILEDGLAHASLTGPIAIDLHAPGQVDPGDPFSVSAVVRDAAGRPVDGIAVTLSVRGGAPATASGTTGADGTVTLGFVAGTGDIDVAAQATVPDLDLQVYGPSGAPAQRVGLARNIDVRVEAVVSAPAPTTSTTTTTTTVPPTTTTTTVPPTTTTTLPPTTTTLPPTTTTTVPPTTTTTAPTTTTTVPPTPTTATPSSTTTTTTPVPVRAPAAPSSPAPDRPGAVPPARTPAGGGTLPVTGARQLGMTLIGAGLVLVGAAVWIASRGRRHDRI